MISVYTGQRWLLVTTLMIALSGCASVIDGLPITYKPELRQGTLIQESAVDQLEVGMSERQVRFILGPPTLIDPFSDNRWDYVYEVDPRSADVEPVSHHLTVLFANGALTEARGSFIDADHPLYQR